MTNYLIVSKDTLDEVASSMAAGNPYHESNIRSFFERDMQEADIRNCDIVVFRQDGQWKSIAIDRFYDIPFVMREILGPDAFTHVNGHILGRSFLSHNGIVTHRWCRDCATHIPWAATVQEAQSWEAREVETHE